MAQYWENHFGAALESDVLNAFISYAANNGDLLLGYYGLPYINMHMGNLQLICKLRKSTDKEYELYSYDTHSIGGCVGCKSFVFC